MHANRFISKVAPVVYLVILIENYCPSLYVCMCFFFLFILQFCKFQKKITCGIVEMFSRL